MMDDVFADRRDAGRRLGAALQRDAAIDGAAAIVLALPRGGIPVGYEVASALGAPLAAFVVRKLGVPWHPELAMGAIASGGVRVLNEDVVRHLSIPDEAVARVAEREGQELTRREQQYNGSRPLPPLAGRDVVLVDDGLATGSTMKAAVQAVRQYRPARVVVAVPVGAPDTCAELAREADHVVCLQQPAAFSAVGLWYEDFRQTTDEEVRDLLDAAAQSHA
ncbi:MAG TPA: phosphoribosyltransferase [Vicinamibacterales bacterium]|nr:phosphoribosyltransferase [Vicinamibacterales bacterium]